MKDIESSLIDDQSGSSITTQASQTSTISIVTTKSSFMYVIYWVRMTMGIGVLTLPFYVSKLGLLGGVLGISVAGILSLIKMLFIF